MNTSRPKHITADRQQRLLRITWEDDHESDYPFDGLRAVCPCVECRGGHANMGDPPDPMVVRDTPPTELTVEKVEAVGSYAIQITWNDGHWTGIYNWDMLRTACPCSICLP